MRPWLLSAVAALVPVVVASQPPLAQSPDTAGIRAAFLAGRRVIDSIDQAHHRTVRVNGLTMHYLEWGPPTAAPLIWLHGSAGSAYEFRHLGPRMAALGYRVIAPSYRGHGQSVTENYDFGWLI